MDEFKFPPSAQADLDEIRRALAYLVAPGAAAELRCLTQFGAASGYFNDMDLLATEAVRQSGHVSGVYVTLNPVMDDLLARAFNRMRDRTREGDTTKDHEILKRCWMPVDCDAKRVAGVSASDVEHEAAVERTWAIRDYLRKEGWPDPLVADSGNGGHLLYAISLPNDDPSRDLVKEHLNALAARFDDEKVTVDRSTFNAARIWKLYGTMACKGDNIPSRPHRLTRILEAPPKRELVDLKARAAIVPVVVKAEIAPPRIPTTEPPKTKRSEQPLGQGDYSTLNVILWFRSHGCYGRPMANGKHAVLCPWAHEHSDERRAEDSDTAVWEAVAGRWPEFHCLHGHCVGRSIRDVIDLWADADAYCSSSFQPTGGWPAGSAPPESSFSIEPLRKVLTDPPRFVATVSGRDVECSESDLFNWHLFKPKVSLRVLHCIPQLPAVNGGDGKPLRPQVVWERYYLDPALQRMTTVEEAPSDAGARGALWENVKSFLRNEKRYTDREKLAGGGIVELDSALLFRGDALRRWLSRTRVSFREDDLWLAVRGNGGVPQRKKVGGKTTAIWSVPRSAVDDGEEVPQEVT